MSLKRIFIIAILLFLLTSLRAQEKWTDDLEVGIQYGSGYVLPEYDFINLVTEDYTSTIELSIQKNSYGQTDWERVYHYPSYGIRLLRSSLGSQDVLGELWGIYPYIEINIFKFKRIKFLNQTGLGYSRVNKKFDLEENYLNVAVGSYSNMHFNSRFTLELRLLDRLFLQSSLSFDHFSNANTSEPNLGINYISWMNGLSYAIGNQHERIQGEVFEKEKGLEKEIAFAIGGKHSRALASTYYFTSSFTYEVRKAYFRALHLGLGADVFYDTSVEDQLIKDEKDYSSIDQFQSGIHFSQTLVYGKFSLTLQEGIYLGLTEKVNNYSIYNRGIAKYKVGEHMSIRFHMKSHLHILDYPEIGIGWIL